MRWLAVIVLGGAVLRLVGLDEQSFWRDEASTVLGVSGGLRDTLDWVVEQEAQPPLYYVSTWLWTQLFGIGEVGVRSLSALAGVATIPVAYGIGRQCSRRAGLLAAALVAANPFLVWYSQEGRSYALLVLVTALATLALVKDSRRGWALAAAAALLTHYLTAFLLIPQALVMIRRHRRAALPALMLPTATGLALIPLIVAQRDGRVDGIPYESLGGRIVDVGKHWTVGPFGTPVDAVGVVALAALVTGVVLAVARRRALTVLVAVPFAIGVPIVLSLLGADYFNDRYVIGALVLLLVGVAAGLEQRWWLGAGLAALFAAFAISNALDEERQREDWRAVAARPGPAALIATADGDRPLRVYGARPLTGTTADQILFVASWRFGRERPADLVPPPGFTLAEREEGPTTTVLRYEAPEPVPIDPDALALQWLLYGEPSVQLELP